MNKTYKFRLYPSRKQTILLNKTLKTCKHLYNLQLEYERYIFTKEKRFANKLELNNLIPDLKIINPELKTTYSQILQNINDRVTKSFQGFFNRIKKGQKAGYPRFKSTFNSFTYPQSGFQIKNKLKLSKIGEIQIKLHRKIKGNIKNLTILKTPTNKWFACFTVEQDIPKLKRSSNKIIGIDLGLKKFATLSDNKIIENPRTLKKSLDLLQRKSKQLSKKKKGSKNRNKAKLKLAMIDYWVHHHQQTERNDTHKSEHLKKMYKLLKAKWQIKNE